MSLRTSLSEDLPNIYKELADATATYKTIDIDVFFDDDYGVESISNKVIKAMTFDVSLIALGDQITIDAVIYKVLNFNLTDDELETIIALSKV